MIIYFLLVALVYVVSLIFAVFPTVTELPWGVDNFMTAGVGYYKLMAESYPPFLTFFNAFVIYLGFRLSIIVLRFFLGSRTPTDA